MAQPDPRDDEFIKQICSAVTGMIWAVHQGDNPEIAAQMSRLLTAIIAYHATLGERPGDGALRQAVARLR
jgi:hypothetical protein